MASTQVTISGSVPLASGGSKTISPPVKTNLNIVDEIDYKALASGDNTFGVPFGAVGVVITPPALNTTQVKLKNVTGDTGIALHKTFATDLAIDPTQTSIILNAAAPMTADTELNWY